MPELHFPSQTRFTSGGNKTCLQFYNANLISMISPGRIR
jgi:hypothetical protein